MSPIPNLAARLTRSVTFGADDECWLWQGKVDRDGYGIIVDRGRSLRAHRVMYELKVGPIPTGLVLDHLCRVPRCVNPVHLEAVTSAVNVLRGRGIAALNAQKLFCKYGHSLRDAYVYPAGGRQCRECTRRQDETRRGPMPRRTKDEIGRAIALVAGGLSRRAAARTVGIDSSYLSKVMRGERRKEWSL